MGTDFRPTKGDFMISSAKIIGIGNAGISVVEKLTPQDIIGRMAYETIAVDTDKETLDNTLILKKVQIGIETIAKEGISDKFALGKASMAEQLGNVIEAIDNTDFVFLLSGFGNGVSAGATLELASSLKLLGISTFCFTIEPFCFEGKEKRKCYNRGIELLSEKGINYFPIIADDFLKSIELPNEILQQIFNNLDFSLEGILKSVLKEA